MLQRNVADAAEQAALLPWLPIEYRQMSPGGYAGGFEELALGNLRVIEEWQSQAVQKVGVMAPDCCTVSVVASGGLQFSQHAVMPMHTYLLPASTEFDVQVPPNLRTLFVRLPQDTLLDRLYTLDERTEASFQKNITAFATSGSTAYLATLDALFDLARSPGGLPDPVQMGRTLLDCILLTLNDACKIVHGDDPGLHARRRVSHVVSRAREYIEASLLADEAPFMAEICAHAGVSERTLQYSFREHLGMTPIRYLRIARLHRVRRELSRPQAPHVSVTQIAMHCGFLHLGAFARDYRAMFHERPSETLSRALRQRFPGRWPPPQLLRKSDSRNLTLPSPSGMFSKHACPEHFPRRPESP